MGDLVDKNCCVCNVVCSDANCTVKSDLTRVAVDMYKVTIDLQTAKAMMTSKTEVFRCWETD